MAIEVKCKCGSEYRLDDSRAGETFSCRVCGASITLQAGVGRASPTDADGAPQPEAVATASTVASPTPPGPPARPSPPDGRQLGEFGDSLDVPTAEGAETPSSPPPTAPRKPVEPLLSARMPGNASPSPVPHPPAMPTGRPTRPPLSWWLARAILWGLCAGFFFLPWFFVADSSTADQTVRNNHAGLELFKSTWQGMGSAGADSGSTHLPYPIDFFDVSDDSGRIAIGAAMMKFSPCVFGLGLLLVIAIIPIATSKDGAGAMWPFLTCLLGLGGFIVGWHLVAGAEQAAPQLEIASQVGITVGVSGWAYAMAVVLVPIILIARGRPDYRLVQAAQWSKQQSSTGPF